MENTKNIHIIENISLRLRRGGTATRKLLSSTYICKKEKKNKDELYICLIGLGC